MLVDQINNPKNGDHFKNQARLCVCVHVRACFDTFDVILSRRKPTPLPLCDGAITSTDCQRPNGELAGKSHIRCSFV